MNHGQARVCRLGVVRVVTSWEMVTCCSRTLQPRKPRRPLTRSSQRRRAASAPAATAAAADVPDAIYYEEAEHNGVGLGRGCAAAGCC